MALFAWLAGAFYTLEWNPEIAFFRQANRLKQAWAAELDRDFASKVVVFGGSSCTVSVDGAGLLAREHLPVLNLGLGAGMGAKVLTGYALQSTRPGDTLIVAMEPSLLVGPMDLPALGVQFCYATGNLKVLRDMDAFPGFQTALDLRPGGYHFFTLLSKLILHQPLYRYRLGELQAGGWHRLELQRSFVAADPGPMALSDEGRDLLRRLREWCVRHRVRVAYSLPWVYEPVDRVETGRGMNAAFLLQVSEYLPVLKDPRLGVDTVRSDFADTPWHLIPSAAERRSQELARQVQDWRWWSQDELKQVATVHSPR